MRSPRPRSRRGAFLFLIPLCIGLLASDVPPHAQEFCCAGGWAGGEIIVSFQPGTTPAVAEGIATSVGAAIIRQIGVTQPRYLMRVPLAEEMAFIPLFEFYGEVMHAEPNRTICSPEDPDCACCPCGLFCPTLPTCGECAANVPDGDSFPGTPLSIDHAAEGDIRLSWGASCLTSDLDYGIYEGTLGDFTTHERVACTTGGATTLTFTPSAQSAYYLVVPRNDVKEGSYGVDSRRHQRPASAIPCRARGVAVRFGCALVCGDGVRRGDETCDGADLGGATCSDHGFDGGALACDASCAPDTTGCTTLCGDGVRRGLEECDGSDLGGVTCSDVDFAGGTLGCDASCRFDATGCTTVCGDGMAQGEEVCDGPDLAGRGCLGEGFDGGFLVCDPSCDGFSTSECTDCGDGVREGSELCDGQDLGGESCPSRGFTGGALACTAECFFDFSSCTTCGNGVREGAEVCDGADLAGQTCVTRGFTGGTLACNASCTGFDDSMCTRCGDGVRQGGEVCDGADLGGATCASFGFSGGDLGCSPACTAYDTTLCLP